MSASPASPADILEINVGGRILTTRRATLTLEPDSMLRSLFSEDSPFRSPPSDSCGRPFLDSDGDTFSLILDYLRRGGRLIGPASLSADAQARLRADAEYYGLTSLVKALDLFEAEKGPEEERPNRPAKEYRGCVLRMNGPDLRHECEDNTRLNKLCQDGWQVAQATYTVNPGHHPHFGILLERERTTFVLR